MNEPGRPLAKILPDRFESSDSVRQRSFGKGLRLERMVPSLGPLGWGVAKEKSLLILQGLNDLSVVRNSIAEVPGNAQPVFQILQGSRKRQVVDSSELVICRYESIAVDPLSQ